MNRSHRMLPILALASFAAPLLAQLPSAATCERWLTPDGLGRGPRFGYGVAIDGDTAVVGEETSTGVGEAHVFVRSGTIWREQAVLANPDRTPEDDFGSAVAISGDTIVVGARYDRHAGIQSGAAYVFVRSGTTWTQQSRLVATGARAQDRFGAAVAISGDRIAIAAEGDWGAFVATGAVHVFVRSGSNWTFEAKLTATDAGPSDGFGASVAIDGDTVVVGRPGDDLIGWGDSGSAYVFERRAMGWVEGAKLVPADRHEYARFGSAVALRGDTAVIGARSDDGAADGGGAAYVYATDGTTWTQRAKLYAGDAGDGHQFGSAVAFDGATAVVGAPQDAHGVGTSAGSAYVFDAGPWTQRAKLTASDARRWDHFGWSVGVSGDQVVVGAPYLQLGWSGSAYAFPPTVAGSLAPFGAGCLGSNGLPPLHTSDDVPDVGTTVTYEGRQLRPATPAVLWLGFSKTLWGEVPLPLSLGVIGADPSCQLRIAPFLSLPLTVDGSGATALDVRLPLRLDVGAEIYSQILAVDDLVASPLQLTVSNGLEARVGCR